MELLNNILPWAMPFIIPLLITSLGGLFSERSGVVNIGLEGLMIIGSFAAAFTIYYLQASLGEWAIWIGLAVAMAAGILFSMLHAFASVSLNANQVISGTAINLIAAAVTTFAARFMLGSGKIQITSTQTRFDFSSLNEVPIVGPVLSILQDIPILGPFLFQKSYLSNWVVFIILGVAAFVLYKTAFGLRLRACGEHPHAADAAGINVRFMRYVGVGVSGAFAALGGALIVVTYSGEFSGTVSGLGFLSLAALIFGQWKPLGILGATIFFGLATTVSNQGIILPELRVVPPYLLKILPYVATLLALILFSKKSRAPKAVGEPFEQDKR